MSFDIESRTGVTTSPNECSEATLTAAAKVLGLVMDSNVKDSEPTDLFQPLLMEEEWFKVARQNGNIVVGKIVSAGVNGGKLVGISAEELGGSLSDIQTVDTYDAAYFESVDVVIGGENA